MKYLYLFILIFLGSENFAQSLASYIPNDVSYVFSFNFAQLNKKSSDMDYGKYLSSFNKSSQHMYYGGSDYGDCELIAITELMKKPDSFGIDLNENVFLYKYNVRNYSGNVYIFKLKNTAVFENKLNTSCNGYATVQKRNLSSGTYYLGSKSSVAINGNTLIIFMKDYNYWQDNASTEYRENAFEDSLYNVEKAADNLIQDSLLYELLNSGKEINYSDAVAKTLLMADTGIETRAKQRNNERILAKNNEKFLEIQTLLESFLQVKNNSLINDRNFSKVMNESHDAFIYMNVATAITSKYLNPFGSSNYGTPLLQENAMQSIKKSRFFDNVSSTYTIDFESGKAIVKFYTAYNENVYPYFKSAYNVKQNKKLLKYIDGKQLLGYMSIAVNAKELAKMYEAMYSEIIDRIPKSKSQMDINSAVKLAYLLLDKEVLYNTLDGRAILACTGFTDIKIKFKTYNYDDNFAKTEVIDERIIRQPRMVMAASIGNKENAQKLFNIISQFEVFEKVKENVIAVYANNHMPFNIFISLTDDVLIISNDASVVLNPRENAKFPSEDLKKIMSHNTVFKLYADKMILGIKETYFNGIDEKPWVIDLMTKFGNFELTDYKPEKNVYGATAILTLQDNTSNALFQLLKLMQRTNGY